MYKLDARDVCIVDFCGQKHYQETYARWSRPCTVSADWLFLEKLVVFTGEWQDVPDMPAETEPDEDTVEAWAAKHGFLLDDINDGEGHSCDSGYCFV